MMDFPIHIDKVLGCPFTQPRSAVGNVSGNICATDCRSRRGRFDKARSHTFAKIDHGHSPPFGWIIQERLFQLQAKVCARSTG